MPQKRFVLSLATLFALPLAAGCGTPGGTNATSGASPKGDPVAWATTPAPHDFIWFQAHHERNLARARKGDIDVLFLGDSITDGWRSTGREVWQREFAPLGAANFGVSADQTQHILWRLANGELEGYTPKVVVLMAGTNNLKSGPVRMPPKAAAAGVEAIVALLRDRFPDVQILLQGILPRQPKYPWIAEAIRDTNARLAAFAEATPRVRYVDFGDRFLGHDGEVNPDLMPDRLHPSKAGYEVWADTIRDDVRALLAEAEADAGGAAD